VKRSRFSWRWA